MTGRTEYAIVAADLRTAEWSRIVAIHHEAETLERVAEACNDGATGQLFRVMTLAEAQERVS